jgi:GNAT superfamily N-acetyltransferase
LDAGEQRTLEVWFNTPREHTALFVAERDDGSVLGAAYAEQLQDYFTREMHGHLGILMVADHAEGVGVGRALMSAIEQWARDKGYRFLTLNVFAANERARRFYEHVGYQADIVKYVKPL